MGRRLIPDEFQVELDAERSRWLRRRFIAYCVVTLALYVPIWIVRPTGREDSQARLILHGTDSLLVVLYLAAAIYVQVWRPNRNRIVLTAQWVSILSGVMCMVGMRIAAGVDPTGVFGKSIHDHPVNMPATLCMALSFYVVLIFDFLTCLFLPWTVLESLPLAASLLGTYYAITLRDMGRGLVDPLLAVSLLFLVTMLVGPGTFLCWWRDWKFRKRFRLTFESRGYRKLQHELADARRVHESCLARPRTSGAIRMHYAYEPMRMIGGDLIFVPRVADESSLSAVLLDVTGHGITAALTVNRIVGELQRLFAENALIAPAEVLKALNHYVCLTLSDHDLYMTALSIRVDSIADRFAYCSGGHPTSFFRSARGVIEPLESTATLLGVMDGGDYEIETIERSFGPGDCLIAYTDGASEAKNRTGTMLQTAGIRQLVERVGSEPLSPAEFPIALLQKIQAYRAAPPDDDTLIAAIYRC